MKNKIIVSLVFIVPLAIYFLLLAFNPDRAIEASAEAKMPGNPQVIMFSTPMCGECRKMAPIFEKAKENYKDKVSIVKIDASAANPETQKLVLKYKINVVPTFIYIDKNGKNTLRTEGSMSYETFEKYLQGLISQR